VQPQLTAEEPAFEPLWEATRTRTPVRFDYRTSAGTDVSTRHLQPWGVVSYRGRWYVVGRDTDRDGPRVFRLSRVQGTVVRDGRPDSFEVPPGTDLRAVTQTLAPRPPDRTAVLLVRQGAGHGLRRHARPAADQGDVPAGWERLEATYGSTDSFADEVLGYGADVIVETPEEVRSSVVGRLREAAGLTHVKVSS
jgi:proteasome accessory factor B